MLGLAHVEDKEGIGYCLLVLFVISRAIPVISCCHLVPKCRCVVGNGCVIALVVIMSNFFSVFAKNDS